jgi:hypothetical protein
LEVSAKIRGNNSIEIRHEAQGAQLQEESRMFAEIGGRGDEAERRRKGGARLIVV